jgi:hypothetical protein
MSIRGKHDAAGMKAALQGEHRPAHKRKKMPDSQESGFKVLAT